MPSPDRCASCDAALDLARYTRCDVCRGARFCVGCGQKHLCTAGCATSGCTAGLCVHLVRDGVTDWRSGVHE